MASEVAKELSLKINLERTFKPEIKRVFNVILKDFRSTIAALGVPPQVSTYKSLWEVNLKNHYRRVQKAFSGIVGAEEKFLKQVIDQQQRQEINKEEVFALALIRWRDKQASKQAEVINATTQANMSEAIMMAQEQAAAENKIVNQRELAVASTVLLKRKFNGRVNSIAITETQSSAESTKFIEAEVESGLVPQVLGGRVAVTATIKVWSTVGDKRVRLIHQKTNGQTRRLNEPFVVNGQFLMHPGDSSLGATADNTANCRCISQYSIR